MIRLLPAAEADLEAIADYIARDNPVRAVSFIAELREICRSLAAMPLAFPLVPRYADHGIRHRPHGQYQIFYRPIGTPPCIDILHILHGARDLAAILF